MRNKAELITKISLLKRRIDQCLDERDQEAFNRLSFELKVCQRYLETRMNTPETSVKERLAQNRNKFFHY
ncbi:IDEAL domain-containing protein [Neobacillus niacini]|uniref:IDEAL domain-containing protein n=1 Tax=Neobacillus niacini TaxID=86668 RepID=UPI0007AB477A|nr:IDEAL domain-containing protein [Neobacillus niacini]MEC1520680.1 IDEAL domain-containing protein [Neobacillus niacini]